MAKTRGNKTSATPNRVAKQAAKAPSAPKRNKQLVVKRPVAFAQRLMVAEEEEPVDVDSEPITWKIN